MQSKRSEYATGGRGDHYRVTDRWAPVEQESVATTSTCFAVSRTRGPWERRVPASPACDGWMVGRDSQMGPGGEGRSEKREER
jgi:hypothetical protein